MNFAAQSFTATVGVLLIFAIFFLSYPFQAGASHGSRFSANFPSNPCNPDGAATGLNDTSSSNLSPRGGPAPGTGGFGGGGLHVPVRDFEAEASLRSIDQSLRAIASDTNFAEGDTRAIRSDTQKILQNAQTIRYYLGVLCEKEFEEDHTIQHEWAKIAGKQIGRIVRWINTAYNGNPIYATNPYVYLRNIDIGVTRALIAEVEDARVEGRIDDETAAIIKQALEMTETETVFPDTIDQNFPTKNTFEDRSQFTWESWTEGALSHQTKINNLLAAAIEEVGKRREIAHAVERDKLLWGRGFFPWEVCGQQVFSENPADIRTCKTLTPASTIQDLTSLVLASALRQMENADEYEEWISNQALTALNTVFYGEGLLVGNDPVRSTKLRSFANTAISPEQASVEIDNISADDGSIRTSQRIDGLTAKEKTGIYYGNDEEIFILE